MQSAQTNSTGLACFATVPVTWLVAMALKVIVEVALDLALALAVAVAPGLHGRLPAP